jgi:hypothetical protein
MVFTKIIGIIAVYFVCIPSTAYAYLDPGTGSLILQSLAAGLVTFLAFSRPLIKRIRKFFSRETQQPEKDEK